MTLRLLYLMKANITIAVDTIDANEIINKAII